MVRQRSPKSLGHMEKSSWDEQSFSVHVAEKLVAATAAQGASRHVVSSVAAALWRLTVEKEHTQQAVRHIGKKDYEVGGAADREAVNTGLEHDVAEAVMDRIKVVIPSLIAQSVHGLTSGSSPHSAHGLAPHSTILRRNVALHSGFESTEPIAEKSVQELRAMQRCSGKSGSKCRPSAGGKVNNEVEAGNTMAMELKMTDQLGNSRPRRSCVLAALV